MTVGNIAEHSELSCVIIAAMKKMHPASIVRRKVSGWQCMMYVASRQCASWYFCIFVLSLCIHTCRHSHSLESVRNFYPVATPKKWWLCGARAS